MNAFPTSAPAQPDDEHSLADAWPELAADPDKGQPLDKNRLQALRNVSWFRDNPLALFAEVARGASGPIGHFDLGIRHAALAMTTECASAMLTHEHLGKELRPYGFAGTFQGFSALSDLTGETLPFMEDARAMPRRRWVTPAYPQGNRALLLNVDSRNDTARLDALLHEHTQNGVTDMYRAFTRFIFERFCLVLFGQTYAEQGNAIASAVNDANMCLDQLCSRWIPRPLLSVGPTARRLRAVRHQLAGFAHQVLEDLYRRQAEGGEWVPAFALCDFEKLTDDELADEIMTQFIAGTESTSLVAAWTALMMTRDKAWWHRAHADCTATSSEDLRRGGISREGDFARCLREGLRMFPSFWQYLRVAECDTTVAGQAVKKGTICFVSPYLLQRDPRRYVLPDAFIPDRTQATKQLSLTFGFGRRSCLGGRIAQGLITDVLSAFIRERSEPPTDLSTVPYDGIHPLIFGLKRHGGFPLQMASAQSR